MFKEKNEPPYHRLLFHLSYRITVLVILCLTTPPAIFRDAFGVMCQDDEVNDEPN